MSEGTRIALKEKIEVAIVDSFKLNRKEMTTNPETFMPELEATIDVNLNIELITDAGTGITEMEMFTLVGKTVMGLLKEKH